MLLLYGGTPKGYGGMPKEYSPLVSPDSQKVDLSQLTGCVMEDEWGQVEVEPQQSETLDLEVEPQQPDEDC